jgi:hypothetical protein
MKQQEASPRVVSLGWGRLEIDGGRIFKDAKLYPGGARAWDWNETGTGHGRGIQPADVEELLQKGATVVVLSRGVFQRLNVAAETLQYLEQKGIPVHVLPTKEAVGKYNELCGRQPVGGLFHTTC